MQAKFKRKILKIWFKFKLPFLIFLFLIFLAATIFFLRPVFAFSQEHGLNSVFLWSLAFNKNSPLKSQEGRTNLLILGAAGGNHQGNDLTDTIIFLSLNLKKKKAFLLSLPRDLWSPTLKDKINSAYHYGEEKRTGGGLILAKAITEEVLGQPVHYALLVEFSSFKKAIDVIGGVEIEVERSFDDFLFPIEGKEDDSCGGDPEFKCRFEHVHFEKGWEKMGGERTLKFARSRNAEGEEGGDFARAARQQKVLLAFRNKVFSKEVILNPLKIKKLIDILREGIETDINLAKASYLGRFALVLKKENIQKSFFEEELLMTPPVLEYGKWVLIPPNEDFSLIHQDIEEKLERF